MPPKGSRGVRQLSPEVEAKNRASGARLDKIGRRMPGPFTIEEESIFHLEDGTTETRVRLVPPDEMRCVAKAIGRDNPWRGNRCARIRVKGAVVCRTHGGTLPNVKKAAQRRLAMAALPASERLIHIALVKKKVSNRDRIRALLEVLDRAGVRGVQTIEIELKPWQQILQAVYGEMDPQAAEETAEEQEGIDYEIEADSWDSTGDDEDDEDE